MLRTMPAALRIRALGFLRAMAFTDQCISITFRGDWKQRDRWATAYDRFVMRARVLETVNVRITNGLPPFQVVDLEMPASYRGAEIWLQYGGSDLPRLITKVEFISRRKWDDHVFVTRLRPAVRIPEKHELRIIVLQIPGGILRYINEEHRSYAGNAYVAKAKENNRQSLAPCIRIE